MRSLILATLLASALMGVGCAAHVGYMEPSGSVDLVYAAPGVQVIADYDEPIFYSDGYYWRQSGGGWYRSAYYTGGWVWATPPVAVVRIDRPHRFVHYRPSGYVARSRPMPPPRHAAPPPSSGWRGNAAAPPPSGGWRGNATPPPPSGGWRGNGNSAPPSGGWRGNAAPPPARPAPPPSGWRGRDNGHGHGRH